MVYQDTLTFLSGLAKNNNRSWFEEHREEYRAARENMLEVTARLIDGLSELDPSVRDSALDPAKCMMRINRDIRFSRDKTPYKANFFTFINRDGKKSPFAGYYLHVKPGGESFTGGGIYMPESKVLQKIREGIDRDFDTWRSLAEDKSLIRVFPEGVQASGMLKRPPRGWDHSNPAVDYLKYKGYYTQRFLSDKECMKEDFIGELLSTFRAAKPLVDFINKTIE